MCFCFVITGLYVGDSEGEAGFGSGVSWSVKKSKDVASKELDFDHWFPCYADGMCRCEYLCLLSSSFPRSLFSYSGNNQHVPLLMKQDKFRASAAFCYL